MSVIKNARHTLADLLQKAYVRDKSDTAKEIGCLRIEEKNCSIDSSIESLSGISQKLYNRSYFSSVLIH